MSFTASLRRTDGSSLRAIVVPGGELWRRKFSLSPDIEVQVARPKYFGSGATAPIIGATRFSLPVTRMPGGFD